MFQVVEILSREKENIIPSPEVLTNIISRVSLKESITNRETGRYLYRGEIKGRPSLINVIKNQYTMAKNWKVIVPVGILALVVVLVIATQLGRKPQELAVPAPTDQQQPVAELPVTETAKPPAAAVNVDDVVTDLFSDSSDEISQTSKAMDDDVLLLGLDSQVISDFGQSYNEDDF